MKPENFKMGCWRGQKGVGADKKQKILKAKKLKSRKNIFSVLIKNIHNLDI